MDARPMVPHNAEDIRQRDSLLIRAHAVMSTHPKSARAAGHALTVEMERRKKLREEQKQEERRIRLETARIGFEWARDPVGLESLTTLDLSVPGYDCRKATEWEARVIRAGGGLTPTRFFNVARSREYFRSQLKLGVDASTLDVEAEVVEVNSDLPELDCWQGEVLNAWIDEHILRQRDRTYRAHESFQVVLVLLVLFDPDFDPNTVGYLNCPPWKPTGNVSAYSAFIPRSRRELIQPDILNTDDALTIKTYGAFQPARYDEWVQGKTSLIYFQAARAINLVCAIPSESACGRKTKLTAGEKEKVVVDCVTALLRQGTKIQSITRDELRKRTKLGGGDVSGTAIWTRIAGMKKGRKVRVTALATDPAELAACRLDRETDQNAGNNPGFDLDDP